MSGIERDLAGRDRRGFPNLVQSGNLLFSRACDGVSGPVGAQCERAYGDLQRILGAAGVGLAQVVRLDHFTESQGWLAERQNVRATFFGRPAGLASTGVACRLGQPNALRVAAVALAAGVKKEVLVDGASFGMPAIASVVAGGGYLFVSGILNDGGHSIPPRAGQPEMERQTKGCFATIDAVLQRAGASRRDIARYDVYVSEREVPDSALAEAAVSARAAVHGAFLPFGGEDCLEVTAMVSANPDGPLAFLTASGSTPRGLVRNLWEALGHAGIPPDRLVRLDVCQPHHDREEEVLSALHSACGRQGPVVVPFVGRSLAAVPFTAIAIAAVTV